MALLKEFRRPQPLAMYVHPSMVARDGQARGWLVPENPGTFNNGALISTAISSFAFVGAIVPVGTLTVAYPCRWGRRRGVLPALIPPIPPGPG